MKFFQFMNNKEVKNAGWIVGGRVVQMVIAFFVGIMTTRYLGPSNYGLINYVAAYTAFFSSLCTLGINAVIIKNFHDYPNEEGTTLGTTIVLRLVSSAVSALMIVGLIAVIDKGETVTITVAGIYCIYLLFEAFDSINKWFQSRYRSKIPTIISTIAYISTAVYKVVLLVLQKSVYWFAFSMTVDYIVIGILLVILYKREGGMALRFSFSKGKQLLGESYHYIVSGMMVAIYGHVDRFMLKQMVNEAEVGYYSVAYSLCTMWVFVLTAIIDSLYPTIIQLHSENYKAYERKNRQLYCIVFYTSFFVSILFTLFGEIAINILYGDEFINSVMPLKAITWYIAFSYLGVARNAWIVSEKKQKYLKYMYFSAVIVNVVLNYFLIPLIGATGAAIASLITEICTSMLIPFCITEMRPNVKLMLDAILLRNVFDHKER